MTIAIMWYYLKTMDGRILSRTHGLKPEDRWPWVLRNVMADAECDENDIDIEEAEDYITVCGKPYAQVLRYAHKIA